MRASVRPLVALLVALPAGGAAQSITRLPRLEGGAPPAPPSAAPLTPVAGGGYGAPAGVGGWDAPAPGSAIPVGSLRRSGAPPRVIVVGVPLWYTGYGLGLWPAWEPLWGGGSSVAASAPPATPPSPPSSPPSRSRLIEVRPGATMTADALEAAPLAGGLLRVAWTGTEEDTAGREVTLLIADAERRVLAAQTVRAAPYRAVFEAGDRARYVGVTLVRADGVSTTTLVPRAVAVAP